MAGFKAIVTGGARGIGYALTAALLEAGGKVHFLDVLASEGVKAQKTFDKQYGSGKAVFVQCDVSKKDELREVFHEAKSQMDGLNVVCNNAAVVTMDLDEEKSRFEEMLSTNFGGVINGCFLGIELMGKKQGGNGGVIINTSSSTALAPSLSYSPVYSAIKAGIIHFSQCIAQMSHSDHGVRISCICPHAVFTEMILLQMEAVYEGRKKMPEQFGNKTPEEILGIFVQPTDISNVVMDLINDESKNNQVVSIMKNQHNLDQIVVENVVNMQ